MKSRTRTKREIMSGIETAFKIAKANGYKIVVATDEEMNSWNELMFCKDIALFVEAEDTKDNVIAMGVDRYVEESEIFSDSFYKKVEEMGKEYEKKILTNSK